MLCWHGRSTSRLSTVRTGATDPHGALAALHGPLVRTTLAIRPRADLDARSCAPARPGAGTTRLARVTMARTQAGTTARGYGQAHRNIRASLLNAWKPGDPCARCGQPMWYRWMRDKHGRKISAIDLGHLDGDKTRYQGLEHATQCNRAAGGRRSGQLRRARKRWLTSRTW